MDHREKRQLRRLESRKKICLPVGSKAEDTLQTLALTSDTSGYMQESGSSWMSSLDGSGSDNSVVSGPSSPSTDFHSLRCRGCERLFHNMSRREPPRKNRRAGNPALLSCDVWLLKKKWQPRRRQQIRGRLWVHLKRIRLQAAHQSNDRITTKAWETCSRPHMFLQRNLRRCKKFFGKLSKSKAKPVHKAKISPLLGEEKYSRRKKKRKSIEKDDTSERLSVSSDLTTTAEDELHENDIIHQEQLKKVSKKQSGSDVSCLSGIEVLNGSDLDRTRRVLKFDTSLNDVLAKKTLKTKHCLVPSIVGGKLIEGQTDVMMERLNDSQSKDSDVFRTPSDIYCRDVKMRSPRPLGVQKRTFMTMLASHRRGHNQITKESHH